MERWKTDIEDEMIPCSGAKRLKIPNDKYDPTMYNNLRQSRLKPGDRVGFAKETRTVQK